MYDELTSSEFYKSDAGTIYCGSCLDVLLELPEKSVQCCVTSPPYWGLRDYGVDGQLGLEDTPDEFVKSLVIVFDGVYRVLADDGVLFVNIGDCYAANRCGTDYPGEGMAGGKERGRPRGYSPRRDCKNYGLKHKDLCGIPWRLAFALQEYGWYLRADIIWHKPNAMPESVRDRPTMAHEYIFMLTKNEKYYYDKSAVLEPLAEATIKDIQSRRRTAHHNGQTKQFGKMAGLGGGPRVASMDGRNIRSVWNMKTERFKGAHFATFPEAIPERCIAATTRPGDVVLDPFSGSGTTASVAKRMDRRFVAIELNEEYAELSRQRIFAPWEIGAIGPTFQFDM